MMISSVSSFYHYNIRERIRIRSVVELALKSVFNCNYSGTLITSNFYAGLSGEFLVLSHRAIFVVVLIILIKFR